MGRAALRPLCACRRHPPCLTQVLLASELRLVQGTSLQGWGQTWALCWHYTRLCLLWVPGYAQQLWGCWAPSALLL